MRKVLFLVLHELQLLMKDRQALGLLFFMPVMFIVFVTLALQDIYLTKVGKKIQLELIAENKCEKGLCADLLTELRRLQYDIQVLDKPTNTRQLTIVLPKDIERTVEIIKKNERLSEGDRVQLVFDPTIDQSIRALVEANLMLALQSVMIQQVHKDTEDMPKGAITVADVNHFAGLIDEKAANGFILPNPIQQTVPAWSLFGMFFIVIPLANSMIRDRKLGVFKRLLSFPVKRGHLIAGKVLPFLILNVLQFALMFAMGIFVLPKITNLNLVLDFNYASLLLVTAACAFAATSFGLMIACLARTSEQASAFGSLSVVILAIMGGVMIPRFVMPDFMQKISLLSPLYWGLESYLDIIVRKADFQLTLTKILVLLGFGIVCLGVARLRFRWSETE